MLRNLNLKTVASVYPPLPAATAAYDDVIVRAPVLTYCNNGFLE